MTALKNEIIEVEYEQSDKYINKQLMFCDNLLPENLRESKDILSKARNKDLFVDLSKRIRQIDRD